ncbi:MAG: anti-sigma factor [Kofleriaceae bacterium]
MNPRVEELLAERAQRPLDDKEHWELQQLGATDDESFDIAAAAVVVATTVIEPMPQALADKILAGAPGVGLDWRRTLPGVAMPPPPDQARDTMVSVNLSDLQPEIERLEIERLELERRELEKATEPLLAQKPPVATKAMNVPSAALDTLPPPMRGRAPAFVAPSLVDGVAASGATPEVDLKAATLSPEPFVSQEPVEPHVRFASVLTPQPQAAVQAPLQALVPRAPVMPIAPAPPPDGRTPLPQDSQPFSVETPPMAVPISRDRQPVAPSILPPQDELAARRAAHRRAADTVPLRRPTRDVVPWLAAAACLLVAGGAVWWGMQQRNDQQPIVATTASTPASDRAALVASATDLAKITWTVTPDPNAHGATGDVVWSAAQQKGYLRFVGLKPNDPAQYQYQLWIFDKTRDQAFPVDGGVFDVASDGEVIVPISPKLHVNDLALFAVTVEKPGGVVVSKRERIVVTAART